MLHCSTKEIAISQPISVSKDDIECNDNWAMSADAKSPYTFRCGDGGKFTCADGVNGCPQCEGLNEIWAKFIPNDLGFLKVYPNTFSTSPYDSNEWDLQRISLKRDGHAIWVRRRKKMKSSKISHNILKSSSSYLTQGHVTGLLPQRRTISDMLTNQYVRTREVTTLFQEPIMSRWVKVFSN